MEHALRTRLELFRAALNDSLVKAEDLLKQTEGTGAVLTDLLKRKLELVETISKFKAETLHYIERAPEVSTDIITQCTQLELRANKVVADIAGLLTVHEATTIRPNEQRNQQFCVSSAKLPKFQLPTFEGDILKWHDFWDQFDASVNSGTQNDAVKMAYLVASLKGPALQAIEGLGSTNKNYKIAVETLQRRYGNKQYVIDAHYKALLHIESAKDIPSDCRRVLNNIEKNIRVLQSLGEDTSSNALRTTLLNKFPERVMFQLNIAIKGNSSVEAIREHLDHIITAMELSQLQPQIQDDKPASTTEALHVRANSKPRQTKFTPSSRKINELTRPNYTKKALKRKSEETRDEAKKKRLSCIFCHGNHQNNKCDTIKTLNERMKKLGSRCFKCFAEGHRSRQCTKRIVCWSCSGPHNVALCRKDLPGRNQTVSNALNTTSCQGHNRKSFLQTATARALNNGESVPCRILLDSGSQRSYVTERLARILALSSIKEDLLMIYTFGSLQPMETLSPSTIITIETRRGAQRKLQVNVVPSITDQIPIPALSSSILVDIVADDGSGGQGIDILIGNDYYFSFITGNMIKVDEDLYLADTEFGWIVSGQMEISEDRNVLAVVTYHQGDPGYSYFAEPDLPLRNMDIKFLWSLENIGITDSAKATREDEAVHHFNDTVQYQDGRYFVKWPWTQYPPDLPTNYGLAYGRLKGLLQRSDTATLQEYDAILREQCESEIIEVIDPQLDAKRQTVPPIHYLPHHIVRQPGKRGRIVYDASARLKDERSLNECMYRGPCMLQDLTALLLSFRTNNIALLADVEKAFLQVGLQPDDRDVTRFLWLKDISKPLSDDNVIHLRFCRVPFGIISSPFLLTATIRNHMSKKNEDLLERIADKCYVDNLVTGANTTHEACRLYSEARSVFQELSMNIRDWMSNDKATMDKIPEQNRAKQTDQVKVLGVLWNVKEDSLQLRVNKDMLNEERLASTNKREVLRTIASIYDPCGYISPLIMPAKLLLQELWQRKYKWETTLPEDLLVQWKEAVISLRNMKNVVMPRYVGPETGKANARYQLHCFTDASQSSYAAVAYLRVEDASGIKISLLMSKARVAPLKDRDNLKIPRLELIGYLIGNRLLTYLMKNIALPNVEQFLWTDSLVVLSWIEAKRLLPPFVARRVEEIKRSTEVQRCYIQTDENPADVATRPATWTKKRDLWFQGPAFLAKDRSMWPRNMYLENHLVSLSAVAEGLDVEKEEVTIEVPVECVNQDSMQPTALEDAVLENEVLENDIQVDAVQSEILEDLPIIQETTESRSVVSQLREILKLQSRHFPEECKGKRTHLARNLGLFKDVDGLLRSKGRLAHADLSYETKHPILLPRDCDFTTKIIKEAHEQNYHVGVPHTLSVVREQYWIPQGRLQVKKVISKCPQCVKHGGGPYQLPSTPALPVERVRYAAPFTYTGVDYFGPMYVCTTNGKEKRWICLFTCLVVRAIHLEVVKDLTAEECLMAFRRLAATRNRPSLIISDNALQFKLTSEVLMSGYCTQNQIVWKFIPQLAPWHGAAYERLIGVVKHCLKRTLGKHLLNETQLLTVMKEVEAVVNTRPLTYVGDDIDYVLKPADFLSLGKCLSLDLDINKPMISGTVTKENLVEGWRRGQNIIKEFKIMFIGQYLLSLRERYQHSPKQPRVKSHDTPSVGDVVQIKGESKNRELWKVGRITGLIKGPDGEVRVAKVRVGNIDFTRSIGHLYPLEVDLEPNNLTENILESLDIPDLPREPDVPTTQENFEQTSDSPHQEQEAMEVEDLDALRDLGEVSGQAQVNEMESDLGEAAPGGVADIVSEISPELTNGDTEAQTTEMSQACDNLASQDIRVRRNAALRARDKIAEWTRQLFALL